MTWKILLALLVMLAGAGCADRGPPRLYVFRLVRPDGVTHKEIKLLAYNPSVAAFPSGQAVMHVNSVIPQAPIGWLWEIEPVVEKEEQR